MPRSLGEALKGLKRGPWGDALEKAFGKGTLGRFLGEALGGGSGGRSLGGKPFGRMPFGRIPLGKALGGGPLPI